MMNNGIIDVETVDFRGGLLEVSLIVINEKLEIVREVKSLRTNIECPKDHISGLDKFPIGQYSVEEVIAILKNEMKDIDLIIGWNVPFDQRILGKYGLMLNNVRDALGMTKRYLVSNSLVEPGNYKLATCRGFFGVKEQGLHNSYSDCISVLEILRKLK